MSVLTDSVRTSSEVTMIDEKDIKSVGKFQKTHALKGELNAILDIDPQYVEEGNAIILDVDGIFVPFFASSVRPKGSTSYLIKLDGIDSEEEAKPFVNKIIYGIKSELAAFLDLEEDDILEDDDMVGYRIIDEANGSEIGKVESLDSSTDNLLFVVITGDGEEIFIPAAEEFVDEINDDEKIIKMSLPDGLLDLNKKG